MSWPATVIIILTIINFAESHPNQSQRTKSPEVPSIRSTMQDNCYDRFLLLACSYACNISLPTKSRREILQTLTNYSHQRDIPFSRVHFPSSRLVINNDCVKINSNADAFAAYVVASKTFVLEFTNESSSENETGKLVQWLQNFGLASLHPITTNATQIDQILERQKHTKDEDPPTIVLLLHSNSCPFQNYRNQRGLSSWAATRFYSKLAESLIDNLRRLILMQMNVNADNGLNRVFLQKRLHGVDLANECPRLCLIKKGQFFLDYHNYNDKSINLYENQTLRLLREFIENSLNETLSSAMEWKELGEPLTDIQYDYYALDFAAKDHLINKKFIAIGTTGGIGVIVLAISIFWGLKSSSYTGVTQSAILAIANQQPSMFLTAKRANKRHSSM